MRSDFAAFILTNGRPDSVLTLTALRSHGYTGEVYLIVDDEDKTLPRYRELFGSRVIVFSKEDIAHRFDEADNFDDRRAIFYARNACFDLAEQLGVKYFIQLDDDYSAFSLRLDKDLSYIYRRSPPLDRVFEVLLSYYEAIPAKTICFSQGGDYIGGEGNKSVGDIATKRKAMNTFICSTERRIEFVGRVNEDVNTYVLAALRGELMLTIMPVQIVQRNTQRGKGGMSEIYLEAGTYSKSFYSVMMAPACVSIASMGEVNRRLHHKVDWRHAAVQILPERYRKDLPDDAK